MLSKAEEAHILLALENVEYRLPCENFDCKDTCTNYPIDNRAQVTGPNQNFDPLRRKSTHMPHSCNCVPLLPRSTVCATPCATVQSQCRLSRTCRPGVQGFCGNQAVVACSVRLDHFRSSIAERESGSCKLARAGNAAKVNERPALLSWKPQHIARLNVTVDISCCVQILQPLCHVRHDLLAQGVEHTE
jgi:hypothetical protein